MIGRALTRRSYQQLCYEVFISKHHWRRFTRVTTSENAGKVLAIRREESSVWERRAPLNPGHVESLVRTGIKVLVQPSTRRAYSMPEYERAGALITDDIDHADVIIG